MRPLTEEHLGIYLCLLFPIVFLSLFGRDDTYCANAVVKDIPSSLTLITNFFSR